MCVVVSRHLGKAITARRPAARLPLHPSRLSGASMASSNLSTGETCTVSIRASAPHRPTVRRLDAARHLLTLPIKPSAFSPLPLESWQTRPRPHHLHQQTHSGLQTKAGSQGRSLPSVGSRSSRRPHPAGDRSRPEAVSAHPGYDRSAIAPPLPPHHNAAALSALSRAIKTARLHPTSKNKKTIKYSNINLLISELMNIQRIHK